MLNAKTRGIFLGVYMRIYGMFLGSLLASCAVEGPDSLQAVEGQHRAELIEAASSPEALAEARGLLSARIDTSRLNLSPAADVTAPAVFDGSVVTNALQAATGSLFVASWAGPKWNASSETHQVSLDMESGAVLIADAGEYERGLAQADDATFLANASALFNAIAPDAAAALLEVKHLGGTTQQMQGEPQPQDARLGSKVFAFRTLGGLRVAGNRMVASYKTDGTLRTVRGLWPAIDLDNSQLSSALSQGQVVERALEVLLAANVRRTGDDVIELESFYELRTNASGQRVAMLRASALVQTFGPDGAAGRVERHDFDI